MERQYNSNFEQEIVSTPKILPMQPTFSKHKAKFVSDHQLDLKLGKMSSEMKPKDKNIVEEIRSNTQYRESINGMQS